ncbi:MAG: hypothetical protein ACR2QJ_12495 [Geminicoccaceae bacterium]
MSSGLFDAFRKTLQPVDDQSRAALTKEEADSEQHCAKKIEPINASRNAERSRKLVRYSFVSH